jgi:hypothetical protein
MLKECAPLLLNHGSLCIQDLLDEVMALPADWFALFLLIRGPHRAFQKRSEIFKRFGRCQTEDGLTLSFALPDNGGIKRSRWNSEIHVDCDFNARVLTPRRKVL